MLNSCCRWAMMRRRLISIPPLQNYKGIASPPSPFCGLASEHVERPYDCSGWILVQRNHSGVFMLQLSNEPFSDNRIPWMGLVCSYILHGCCLPGGPINLPEKETPADETSFLALPMLGGTVQAGIAQRPGIVILSSGLWSACLVKTSQRA
ncbi:hypothetical protein VTN02DRAFT_5103 [Thermoascus thermophilus]